MNVTTLPEWMTVEVLHCNFCKVDHLMVLVHGRASAPCTYCGSNNLTQVDGTFVGPPAAF